VNHAAKTALLPRFNAAVCIEQMTRSTVIGAGSGPGVAPDIQAIADELGTAQEDIFKGNVQRAESMLIMQAHTLDTLFQQLLRRGLMNAGEHMEAADMYMRLALRAQSGCRATLETLAELKNPRPVAFVKQANITSGPQQVNNGAAAPVSPARAGDGANPQPQLLEHQADAQWLDTGAAGAAAAGDPALAPMGESDGAAHTGRACKVRRR
jgi:hypothetical protein